MTLESEILDVLRRYDIARITISLSYEKRISVQGSTKTAEEILARRKEYYLRNKSRIRKYQHEYYLMTKGKYAKKRMEVNQNRVITHEDLAKAMAYAYSMNGMVIKAEDLSSTAIQVMQFFGSEREIVGNHLEQEDIALMYQLEDIGLVGTRIEEYNLVDGKEWRVNYFVLNAKKIREYSSRSVKRDEVTDLYGNLPEEAWAR